MVPVDHDRLGRTHAAAQRLIRRGHTVATIAAALGGRVSERTVARWASGHHAAQRILDLLALERLADALVLGGPSGDLR
jgi:hypothetical protein